MNLSFITEMYVPIIVAACLIVGVIVKKWISDVDNKYIPTIVCILGAVLGCVVNRSIDVNVIVAGAASGLASTGLHQAYKNLIEKTDISTKRGTDAK